MADYKVTKKGKQFAVIKDVSDPWYEKWYVVDVASGTQIDYAYSAASAKSALDSLEKGFNAPSDFKAYNSHFGEPIDMPDSLKKMQQALINPKPKKKNTASAIGSTSAKLEAVEDKGAYKLLKMDDGSFGVYVPSTGGYKLGLKSASGAAVSAKSMLKKMAGERLAGMGVDAGSDAVDTLLGAYEGRMRDMYGQAAREMAIKQAKFLDKFQAQREKKLEEVQSGSLSVSDYKAWLKGKALDKQWYGEMVDGLSHDLADADKRAMQMLNGYIPRAYAENYNFATFQVERDVAVKTGFALYNEATVARLISNPEGSLLPDLPEPKANALKDLQWSRQKISACVTQTILQGEPVDAAARRLRSVVGMSSNSAMRAARTALTGAQNLGRLDAGRRAKKMGISLKKQWIATVDARTRYSHRDVDRETVEIEDNFSNGCRCPGDPSGPAHEVYNCRCAMRYVLPGHEYDDLPSVTREGMSYDEWKNEHQTKLEAQKDNLQAQLDEAQAHINDLKKMLPEDRDFGKIVQGGAKASQWTPEKVASSEEFYFNKLKKAIAEDNSFDIDWYKKRLAELKEYDDAGRAYHEAHKMVEPQLTRWQNVADSAKKKLKKITPVSASDSAYRFVDDPYNGIDGKLEADKLLRPYIGDAWRDATKAQRHAAYLYTTNDYDRYNKPLNGFNRSYGNFVGYGMVDIDNEGRGAEIRQLTTFLEGCENPVDRWVRRGTGTGEMDTFFGFPTEGRFANMTDEELQGLVGHSARIGSFLSTGNCVGDSSKVSKYANGVYEGSTGFGGEVDVQIFVPEGAQAAYAVPFSAFDNGGGEHWDGITSQHSFGRENETILQRGGSYTCVGIERHDRKYLVKLELHPEDGYDTFQQ